MATEASAFRTGTRGLPAIFLAPRIRVSVALLAVVAGALALAAAQSLVGRSLAIGLLAIPLVVPVAVAKSATACGMNALACFSRYDRSTIRRLADAVAYAITVTATAAVLGVVIGGAGGLLGVSTLLPLAVPLCFYLGLKELGFLGHRPIVSSGWQVPRRWVSNPSVAPLVWGVFLGSGLATHMPYPSFYALLAITAMVPLPIGVGLMALYGIARATPAIAAALSPRFAATPEVLVLLRLRLLGHATSGLGALALSGGLVSAVVWGQG